MISSFFKLFRTLETALAAEQTKVTTLETAVAASTTKITTLETALADLTARFDKINSACLDDGARRLAAAPCGAISKVQTTKADDESSSSTTDTTSTSNQVLVQTLKFTGIQISTLSSSSAKQNLEAKIALALAIDDATRVKIISIKSVQKRQMRLLAEANDNGVEIVYEIVIKGDLAALKAKGVEMSKQGSAVHTAVIQAVAIEAGVDVSTLTMTSTPMVEAAPSAVSNDELSSNDDTTTTTNTSENEMIIIIASSAGGGSILLAMLALYLCRRSKKQNDVSDDVKKTTSVVPGVELTDKQKEDIREFNVAGTK